VFLTNAPVDQPMQPFDDYDDRSLIEHCYIKESKQPWNLKHPPQKSARAMRLYVLFTLLLFALATAYRLPCEQDDRGKESVGWQRWRRQLLERHCQVIEAETRLRSTGAPPLSYSPVRPPAPCL
jgi:hypothetical protein